MAVEGFGPHLEPNGPEKNAINFFSGETRDQSTQNHRGSDHNDLTATVDGQYSGNIPKNSFSGW